MKDQSDTPQFFELTSPTTEEVGRGEEHELPCGLIACIVPSTSTPKQAQEWKRAAVDVGGRKSLNDPSRVTGAKGVKVVNLVLARCNLVYLRTPNGMPLKLRGVAANGRGPETVREFPAKVESEKDKLELLEGWPAIRGQVRDVVEREGENLEEIAQGLSGN